MSKKNNQIQEKAEKNEINKLLRGILFVLLDEKPRDTKAKILKKIGFKQSEILQICGPSDTTLRTRKHRENKKKKQKGFLSKIGLKE